MPWVAIAIFAAEAVVSFIFPGEGPRLKDLSVSASTYGNVIPQVWGTVRVAGNMIWSSNIIEHKHKVKAGLGSFYNKYTYTVNCAMALCRGPVKTLRRVWANGKLIYDATGESKDITTGKYTYVFYNGGEDQLPDPTITAAIGAVNTPAYRDVSYIMFIDFKLDDFGNQIPQFAAEVYAGPDQIVDAVRWTSDGSTPLRGYLNGQPHVDWDRDVFYLHGTTGIMRVRAGTSIEDAVFAPTVTFGPPIAFVGSAASLLGVAADGYVITAIANGNFTTLAKLDPVSLEVVGLTGCGFVHASDGFEPLIDPVPSDNLAISGVASIVFNRDRTKFITRGWFGYSWEIDVRAMSTSDFSASPYNTKGVPVGGFGGNALNVAQAFTSGPDGKYYLFYGGPGDSFDIPHDKVRLIRFAVGYDGTPLIDIDFLIDNPAPGSLYLQVNNAAEDPNTNSVILFFGSLGHNWVAKFSADTQSIVWQRSVPFPPTGGMVFQRLTTNEIAWVEGGALWILDITTGEMVNRAPDQNFYTDHNYLTTNDLEYSNPGEEGYPVPPLFGVTGDAVFDGQAGRIFNSNYYSTGATLNVNAFTAEGVPLSAIIGDLLQMVGFNPDDYDVTDFSGTTVNGYGYASEYTIKDIISELQQIYLFDLYESDGKLVGVMRGGGVADETISYKALGGSGSGDDDKADFWKEKRLSEADLPSSVNLKYLNSEQDFQTSTAVSKRILAPVPIVFSRQINTVEADIVFDPTEAKNRANAMLYTVWSERTQHQSKLPLAYGYLEPSDLIAVNLQDGRSYFERITHTEFGGDFTTDIETCGTDSGTYVFDYTGDGGTGNSQTVSGIGLVRPFIFNTPYLLDTDASGNTTYSVYYDAIGNLNRSTFKPSTLMQSLNGDDYDIVQQFTKDIMWGSITGIVPTASRGYFSLDWDTRIIIWPANDWFLLSSITDDELVNGTNMCIIGDEVLQFRDAVQNINGSWTIYNLLRGRRGTEWACDTHKRGEQFAFLDTAAVGINQESLDTAGKTLWYKAVGSGQSVLSAEPYHITYEPRDLMPYAPVGLTAVWSTGDLSLKWVRRTRLGGNMKDGTAIVPLQEQTEGYEVDIYNGFGVVIRTLAVNFGATPVATPAITYTATQYAEDFSSPQSYLTFAVYQIGITGRGFGTKQTVFIGGTASQTSRYWGATSLTSLAEADILALSNHDYNNTFDLTATYNASGGKYVYFAYPNTYGVPTHVKVNGLPFSDFTSSTVTVGGLSYRVLRFNNLQHGSAIPVVWA